MQPTSNSGFGSTHVCYERVDDWITEQASNKTLQIQNISATLLSPKHLTRCASCKLFSVVEEWVLLEKVLIKITVYSLSVFDYIFTLTSLKAYWMTHKNRVLSFPELDANLVIKDDNCLPSWKTISLPAYWDVTWQICRTHQAWSPAPWVKGHSVILPRISGISPSQQIFESFVD